MPNEEKKKIFIVEDDEFLSSLIKNRLTREGFSVLVTTDGAQVLEMMKKESPDLVLLDIILPNKLGFEILEEIKNDPGLSAPPIMIISNLSQEEDVRRAQELGAIDYFIKAQIMIDDLVKRVKVFFEMGRENYKPK